MQCSVFLTAALLLCLLSLSFKFVAGIVCPSTAGQRSARPLWIVLLLPDPSQLEPLKHCLHSQGKYGSHSTLRGWGLL